MRRDLGDFQTPPELVAAVLESLGPIGRRWPRVLEPTCGRGHFIAGLLGTRFHPARSRPSRSRTPTASARATSAVDATGRGVHVRIHQADLFDLDLRQRPELARDRPAAGRRQPTLGHQCRAGPARASVQPPDASNSRACDGFAALHRRFEFRRRRGRLAQAHRRAGRSERATIALLCKTSVARRILQRAHRQRLPIANAVDPPDRCGTMVRRGGRCLSVPGRAGSAERSARGPGLRDLAQATSRHR